MLNNKKHWRFCVALEKNRPERKTSSGFLKLYTSVSICSYTVNLKNISSRGAFIKSSHFPLLGEIVTYVVTDRYGRSKTSGNARVVRIVQNSTPDEIGFAIEFNLELAPDILTELSTGPSLAPSLSF